MTEPTPVIIPCTAACWTAMDCPTCGRVCAALDARRDCAACADIAQLRRFGWTWVRITSEDED